jgi:hypothetical protein
VEGHRRGLFAKKAIFEHQDVGMLFWMKGASIDAPCRSRGERHPQSLFQSHGDGRLAVNHGMFTEKNALSWSASDDRRSNVPHGRNRPSAFIFLLAGSPYLIGF